MLSKQTAIITFSKRSVSNGTTPPVTFHSVMKGIKPMWEDDANARGGKWVINLKSLKGDKNMLNQYWENLVLGMIGETIDVSDEITGAVVRHHCS